MQGTVVLERLLNSTAKIKLLEGGSRSSKTWSIIQEILLICQASEGLEFTITREKLTWLKSTVVKDFGKVLHMYGIPIHPTINTRRSEQEYNLLGNEIAFIGADEEKKLSGRSQDYYWMNEVFGMTKMQHDQLEMRTSVGGWIDYNPIAVRMWAYDLEDRPDVELIRSTILDNPFAPDEVVRKIMGYEPTPANIKNGTADPYMWDVYGLGKRAKLKGLIYDNVKIVDAMPADLKKRGYGLDFGFTNDPSALIDCGLHGGEIYLDEIIYDTGMTNPEIYQDARNNGVDMNRYAYADDSAPKDIRELNNLGWRGVKEAKKGKINHGIQVVQQYPINITRRSTGLRNEADRYKWALDRAGENLNKPVDKFNHGWDAVRYWAINELQETTFKSAKFNFKS